MLADADIDKEMAETWKAIQDKHAVDEPEPVKVEAEAAPEAASVETAPVADDRPRDDQGKFAKKETAEAPKEAAAPVVEPTPTDATTRDVNRAPSTWKPGAKAIWDKLPTEVRAEVHRRESDFMSGQSQLLPDAQLGKNLRAVIAPYESLIASENSTPDRAVAELFRTASILRMGSMETKVATVRHILQQYGIPPEAVIGQQGQPQQPNYQDPRVDQLLQQMQEKERAMQTAESQRLQKLVIDWKDAVDATGKPLRPYADNVMAEMQALLPAIQQQSPHLQNQELLQAAYDRALWANPETAKIVKQQEMEAEEAKRRAENQQRVSEAKKASSVNVPRRGSTPTPAKPGSMEETIRETGRALGLFN